MKQLNLILALSALGLLSACQDEAGQEQPQVGIDAAHLVSTENALKTYLKPERCRCTQDPDGKVVWKFVIRERDLDGKEIECELSRGNRRVLQKAIRRFLGHKYDRDDLKIDVKTFRNKALVTVTLFGVEIPNMKEDLTLDFKINGKIYRLHSKEYELVNGVWRKETNKNDDEDICQ